MRRVLYAPNCRRSRVRVSLTGRRLPQLDLVSLRIDDPGKLAVLRVIHFVEDVAAFRFEGRDQSVKIFNAVVDHERSLAWSKLVAVLRTKGPDGRSASRLAIRVGPIERGTAPLLNINAEMALVPSLESRSILCLDKDATDASDSLHVNLRVGCLGVMVAQRDNGRVNRAAASYFPFQNRPATAALRSTHCYPAFGP